MAKCKTKTKCRRNGFFANKALYLTKYGCREAQKKSVRAVPCSNKNTRDARNCKSWLGRRNSHSLSPYTSNTISLSLLSALSSLILLGARLVECFVEAPNPNYRSQLTYQCNNNVPSLKLPGLCPEQKKSSLSRSSSQRRTFKPGSTQGNATFSAYSDICLFVRWMSQSERPSPENAQLFFRLRSLYPRLVSSCLLPSSAQEPDAEPGQNLDAKPMKEPGGAREAIRVSCYDDFSAESKRDCLETQGAPPHPATIELRDDQAKNTGTPQSSTVTTLTKSVSKATDSSIVQKERELKVQQEDNKNEDALEKRADEKMAELQLQMQKIEEEREMLGRVNAKRKSRSRRGSKRKNKSPLKTVTIEEESLAEDERLIDQEPHTQIVSVTTSTVLVQSPSSSTAVPQGTVVRTLTPLISQAPGMSFASSFVPVSRPSPVAQVLSVPRTFFTGPQQQMTPTASLCDTACIARMIEVMSSRHAQTLVGSLEAYRKQTDTQLGELRTMMESIAMMLVHNAQEQEKSDKKDCGVSCFSGVPKEDVRAKETKSSSSSAPDYSNIISKQNEESPTRQVSSSFPQAAGSNVEQSGGAAESQTSTYHVESHTSEEAEHEAVEILAGLFGTSKTTGGAKSGLFGLKKREQRKKNSEGESKRHNRDMAGLLEELDRYVQESRRVSEKAEQLSGKIRSAARDYREKKTAVKIQWATKTVTTTVRSDGEHRPATTTSERSVPTARTMEVLEMEPAETAKSSEKEREDGAKATTESEHEESKERTVEEKVVEKKEEIPQPAMKVDGIEQKEEVEKKAPTENAREEKPIQPKPSGTKSGQTLPPGAPPAPEQDQQGEAGKKEEHCKEKTICVRKTKERRSSVILKAIKEKLSKPVRKGEIRLENRSGGKTDFIKVTLPLDEFNRIVNRLAEEQADEGSD